MNKIVIIDGNSLVNRAYYALPALATKDGKVYNAVFGFVNIIVKLISEHKPTHLVVAFDHARKTFRNEIYAEYKGTRKPMPEELRSQITPLKELLTKMGIKILEKEGIEADDIIGTLANRFDYPSVILTGDRDCLQLISSKTEVWLTKHGISDIVSMNERQLKEEMGLVPSQIIDLKSLMGDASDNIPGVPGIGAKTAEKLLAEYKTLNGVYENIENIKGKQKELLIQNENLARLSYTLATININAGIDCTLDDCKFSLPFSGEVLEAFKEYEFSSLIKRQDLFAAEDEKEETPKTLEVKTKTVMINNLNQLPKFKTLAVFTDENRIELATDETTNYIFGGNLQDLKTVFSDENIEKIFHKLKPLLHTFNGDIKNAQSVSLQSYLVNGIVKNEDLGKLLSAFDVNMPQNATSLVVIHKILQEKLKELNLLELYKSLELPLTYVLYNMEKAGISVDENVLNELGENFSQELNEISKQVYFLAGEEFNINSPKQLGEILFQKLGLPSKGNKKMSTAVDKLEALKNHHPIIDLLLRYRTMAKLQSTYIEGLKAFIKNGKIHTTFNQTQTTTGRLSSNDPNLQNIPVRTKEGKVLRKIFIASENCHLVSADYSQIELRLLAHYSKDRNLIEAYHQGKDIHTTTASQIFGIPYNEVTKEQRRKAKAVNFGIIYGISPFGLSAGTGITVSEAKSYIDKYFLMYPTIKHFLNSSVEEAKQKGYVTSLLGRRRNIVEIFSTNHNTAMFGERAAMNMPLQGTAADIIKLAMRDVSKKIEELGLKSKLILQIHDELIFDVPDGEKAVLVKVVKECMENVMKLEVPLVVDVKIGKNWLEMENVQ